MPLLYSYLGKRITARHERCLFASDHLHVASSTQTSLLRGQPHLSVFSPDPHRGQQFSSAAELLRTPWTQYAGAYCFYR